jgi:hypothetical protein
LVKNTSFDIQGDPSSEMALSFCTKTEMAMKFLYFGVVGRPNKKNDAKKSLAIGIVVLPY